MLQSLCGDGLRRDELRDSRLHGGGLRDDELGGGDLRGSLRGDSGLRWRRGLRGGDGLRGGSSLHSRGLPRILLFGGLCRDVRGGVDLAPQIDKRPIPRRGK
jgi:hypothetical protein